MSQPTSELARQVVDLPRRLKVHRAARGLSLRNVEAATGISNATVLNVERGGDYRVSTLLALAEWLDRETKPRTYPQVAPGVFRLIGPLRSAITGRFLR